MTFSSKGFESTVDAGDTGITEQHERFTTVTYAAGLDRGCGETRVYMYLGCTHWDMDLTTPTQIRSLPHTLAFGIGLLLGIGLMLASGVETPAIAILIVFFIGFFLVGDLRGNNPTED